MISWFTKKLIGSRNERVLKKMNALVSQINAHELALQEQDAEALRERTLSWQHALKKYHPQLISPREQLEALSDTELDALLSLAKEQQQALQQANKKTGRQALMALNEATEREQQLDALALAHEEALDFEETLNELTASYLEEILPEAYAVVKNAARKLGGKSWKAGGSDITWQMVHFDVQLKGGIALHRGSIAEMQTGEGKTLVATLPVYLNALTGRGVHVITVNDYLALRDAQWMGELHRFLGLSVGCIQSRMPAETRREQYNCDITYGTASEFGFDYLRDNGTANTLDDQVQRGHYFAIVDEVDSVLIDEARTPLIISGPASVSTHQFDRWKAPIADILQKQTKLVSEIIAKAKAALEAGNKDEAGLLLYQASCGMPRNSAYMRMMEDPVARKAREQAELFLLQDPRKKQLFALQSELYFTTDEKRHEADLTELGREELDPENPDAFVLLDLTDHFAQIDSNSALSNEQKLQEREKIELQVEESAQRIHNITQLLKAYTLYEKDVHYVLSPNERGEQNVVIVDQNTGREMPGRRWSDGLHQAVEAKEGVTIEGETQTFATITIQNYFRLYEKLAGMTGTAETEAAEFHDIYQLDVLVIPTHRPNQRTDENDRVYKTIREKLKSVIERITESHAKGQPVLVGTASVESSEVLSRMLRRAKIPHSVLNAKQHSKEAEIIARAGRRGAVTVATNMAGRGTDIKLADDVAELGGLLVLGTERHESRRIDRQLRGRSARQGDPGCSVFYLSFEDDLMRNYGASERMTKMMELFKIEEGQELQSGMLTKSVEVAQKRVEQRNYMMRKHVLEYDDVLNQQRTVIYARRNAVLAANDVFALLDETIEEHLLSQCESYLSGPEEGRSPQALLDWANDTFPLSLSAQESDFANKEAHEAAAFLTKEIKESFEALLSNTEPAQARDLTRHIQLGAIDKLWQEHLYNMDNLRQGVSLRAKGQKDPLVEYKTEAFTLFSELMDKIDQEVVQSLFRSTQRYLAFEAQMRAAAQLRREQQNQKPLSAGNMAITGGAELWAALSRQAAATKQAKKKP